MPKKRKTRKEKIVTDQKRQVVHQNESSIIPSSKNETHGTGENIQTVTFSLPTVQEKKPATKPASQAVTISTNEYGYLTTDLMRTALLTISIVLAELVIKVVFKG